MWGVRVDCFWADDLQLQGCARRGRERGEEAAEGAQEDRHEALEGRGAPDQGGSACSFDVSVLVNISHILCID